MIKAILFEFENPAYAELPPRVTKDVLCTLRKFRNCLHSRFQLVFYPSNFLINSPYRSHFFL